MAYNTMSTRITGSSSGRGDAFKLICAEDLKIVSFAVLRVLARAVPGINDTTLSGCFL